MAYVKQKWVEYDENLSEQENIEAGAVVTSNKLNHIEEGVFDVEEGFFIGLKNHTDKRDNPHLVTKEQIGLSNVKNTEQASKSEFDSHVSSKSNPHSVTASQIGLSNVKNIEQASLADFNAHKDNKDIHVTANDKNNWNNKEDKLIVNTTNNVTYSNGWSEAIMDTVSVYRQGSFVTVYFTATNGSTGYGIVVAKLPIWAKPKRSRMVTAHSQGADGTQLQCFLNLDTDGNFKVESSLKNKLLIVSATFEV